MIKTGNSSIRMTHVMLCITKQNGTLHAFYKHLENKINHCFFYILFMHVMLYYKALFVCWKLIYHKIDMHNRSGWLKTGKQRNSHQ